METNPEERSGFGRFEANGAPEHGEPAGSGLALPRIALGHQPMPSVGARRGQLVQGGRAREHASASAWMLALIAVGAVVAAAAVAYAAAVNPQATPAGTAGWLARAAYVLAPAAAGIYAWHLHPEERLGRLLVAFSAAAEINRMAGTYTVKPGDDMSSIAEEAGFAKFETIWDHPENAELKSLRKNPNILNPGDSIFIPDREEKTLDRPVEARHKFKKITEPLKVRIVLNRMYNDPYVNTPCTLLLGLDTTDLTSDGAGQIEKPIKRTTVDGDVKVKDQVKVQASTVPIEREVAFKIGFLDPVTEISGQVARLTNLGYYRGPDAPLDADEFLSAVEEFQCDNKLVVDGKCGPATQAKLVSVHGC